MLAPVAPVVPVVSVRSQLSRLSAYVMRSPSRSAGFHAQCQRLEARLPAQTECPKKRVALRHLILKPESAPLLCSVAETNCSERRCFRQSVARGAGAGWVSRSSP